MEIQGSQFTLRPPKLSDCESLALHANNRKIWMNLTGRFPHPYSEKDAEDFISKVVRGEGPHREFVICVDGHAIGGIGMQLRGDVYARVVEIGYWVGEEYWGRGIATEALKLITEYVFDNFDVDRIEAHVFEWNPASSRVLEKAGYEFEARLKKRIFKDGSLIDELVYVTFRQ